MPIGSVTIETDAALTPDEVNAPAAVPFFASLGFLEASHGHRAMYLRPHPTSHEH